MEKIIRILYENSAAIFALFSRHGYHIYGQDDKANLNNIFESSLLLSTVRNRKVKLLLHAGYSLQNFSTYCLQSLP
jgi:hypothetical protein